MKKSILLDILNGKRGHRDAIRISKEHTESLTALCDVEGTLKSTLSPAQRTLHESFVLALEKSLREEMDAYFIEGFRLGLLIGIECMEQ